MEEIIRSSLTLEKIYFEDIKYHNSFNAFPQQKLEYDLNFIRQVTVSEDQNHCKVSLTANIVSKDKAITAVITMIGLFACDCPDPGLKEALMNENTVAIMFPYLRSQISLITTQPDMPPIVLPPVNVVEMFRNGKEIKE